MRKEHNGRHERLHLTLKTVATQPPSGNVLQQQARSDTFVHEYNHERPHQALDMATPASHYQPSARLYAGLEELEYPAHDWTAVITTCGRICYQRRKVNVSQVFAGQKVAMTWGISMTRRAVSSRSINPSARNCYVSGTGVTHVSGMDQAFLEPATRLELVTC